MKKKLAIVPIVIFVIAIVIIGSQSNPSDQKNEVIFHITLADPSLYKNGIFSDTFTIEEGEYSFRFVPNGDSPQNLTISVMGDEIEFSENFVLNGTLHETGISEYYTWDYDGEKSIQILNQQEVSIKINPNGNTRGSVSVDIITN